MQVLQVVKDSIQFLVDSTTRLFRPSDDQYPNIVPEVDRVNSKLKKVQRSAEFYTF